MTRERLPNRRANETTILKYDGHSYAVTVGLRDSGEPREVFTHGAKVGSTMDALLDDACVLFSLLLQYGAEPKDIAASMSRIGEGNPASVIGAVADLVAGQEAAARKAGG